MISYSPVPNAPASTVKGASNHWPLRDQFVPGDRSCVTGNHVGTCVHKSLQNDISCEEYDRYQGFRRMGCTLMRIANV